LNDGERETECNEALIAREEKLAGDTAEFNKMLAGAKREEETGDN
jgi:hypothetical protein